MLFCFGTGAIISCNSGLARFNRPHYYLTGYQNYQAYKALRKQLDAKSYRRYRHSQLHFEPHELKEGYGLYYAIMPGKKTKYNVKIPCLISPTIRLMNTCYFEGVTDGDTSRLAVSLDSAIQEMAETFPVTGSGFTQAELDSLRKVFLYGAYTSLKPGYHVHYR